MDSDERLIRRMRKGDDSAIEEFVRKYYPAILAYCGKRLGSADLAEDMTQETFLRFFRNFAAYQHFGKTLNYLFTIAGNLCKDGYGKHYAHTEISLDEMDLLMDSDRNRALSYDPFPGMTEKLDIERALSQMPEDYRKALILYYIQELKQNEIAAILGVRCHVVKYRIRKGKRLLQKIMEEGLYE